MDLTSDPALRLGLRTFGTGLAGYPAGWFRTRTAGRTYAGGTARSRVVHVPTTEGYALLLSVPDPERLVARLRELVPS